MRIIGETKRFLLRMHLAIPRHYQMHTQPCIKKKKKKNDRKKPIKAIRHET